MTSGKPHWIIAAAAIGTATLLGACAPAASEPTGAQAPAASETASASPSETASEAPSATPAPSPSSSPSSTPEADPEPTAGDGGVCTAAELSGAVTTEPGAGAAGSVYRTLTLTNTSGAACDVAGYPGVSYVDAAGAQIGAPADRGEPGTAFSLEPGASATAVLRQVNAGNYGADCGAVPAAGVRVYPPGATDSLVLPQETTACSASSIVLMTVGALQPAG
ncbi:DUF4232 domain-containing protein [Arthrobacter zhaoguopingii]|uniref:DUF4232 domain-containing protein n=1 Tax=Arthrobacter zhaoguopingii TaxID=2681491 RepID=UPI001357F779|nr:DUF4232 domain-containing protein [Arthrobacter zhaoguopingii]